MHSTVAIALVVAFSPAAASHPGLAAGLAAGLALQEKLSAPWTSAPRWGDDVALGAALARGAGVALVGAPRAKGPGPRSGRVLAFERVGDGWGSATPLPVEAGPYDQTGCAVDVSPAGDRAVVGAFFADGAAPSCGVVTVLERSGSRWSVRARLAALDAAPLDAFGWSVDLDGDRLLVGAPFRDETGFQRGAAYVFEESGGTWVQTAKLVPAHGADFDRFGHSVALAGALAVVGAPRHDAWAIDAGAAWTFAAGASGWSEEEMLYAPVPAPGGRFGAALGLAGDAPGARLAVGEPGSGAGAVHTLLRSPAGDWVAEATLAAPRPRVGMRFGEALDLVDGRLLSGAPDEDGAGAAHVFAWNGGWLHVARIQAPRALPGQQLGAAVSLHPLRTGGWLVGAPRADGECAWSCASGAAWVGE